MTASEVVLQLIEQETGVTATNETPLEDLPIDSLEFLNLLFLIGQIAGKEIPDAAIPSLATVGDIAKALA